MSILMWLIITGIIILTGFVIFSALLDDKDDWWL